MDLLKLVENSLGEVEGGGRAAHVAGEGLAIRGEQVESVQKRDGKKRGGTGE